MVRAVARGSISEEKGSIPKDFNEGAHTLLVVKGDVRGVNEELEESFQRYQGESLLVTQDELKAERYLDKETYRYEFRVGVFERDNNKTGVMEQGTIRTSEVYLYDRRTNQSYKAGVTSSLFGALINAWVDKLNKDLEKGDEKVMASAEE